MKKDRRCFEKLRILSLGPDVNRYTVTLRFLGSNAESFASRQKVYCHNRLSSVELDRDTTGKPFLSDSKLARE